MSLRIETSSQDLNNITADVLLVACFEGETVQVPQALSERVTKVIELEAFKPKANALLNIHCAESSIAKLVIVGLGDKQAYQQRQAYEAITTGLRVAAKGNVHHVAIAVDSFFHSSLDSQVLVDLAARIAQAEQHSVHTYKKEGQAPKLEQLSIVSQQVSDASSDKGTHLGNAIRLAKELVDAPPNLMTPARLAQAASSLKGDHLSVEVHGRDDIARMGFNLFSGVAQGSSEEPQFIRMNYAPKHASRHIILVGKGVTFDSGGLSLKPSASMEAMKCDMAGAATVIGTMQAVSALNLPIQVTGLVPATENMPGGKAQRLGDVVTAANGKTVEIMNTDAEGRLIMADVLHFASGLKPDAIIDLATLTGACVIAMGNLYAALMSEDESLSQNLRDAASAAGELLWPLPLVPHYRQQLDSTIADMTNTGGRPGGSITAGLFLKEFVDPEIAWAHIDIAGPAFIEATYPFAGKGASGYGVALLTEYLASQSKS